MIYEKRINGKSDENYINERGMINERIIITYNWKMEIR